MDQVEQTRGEAPTQWIALGAVTATVSVFAIAQGLSYPLFTFLMQKQGMTPAEIGFSAAMTPLGIIVAAPLIPFMTRHFGARSLTIGCAIAAALLFTLIGLLQNTFAWYVLRFLLGIAIDPLYVISEVWMISLAPPRRRGRVIGIYTAIIGAGFASGPLCLALVGSEGAAPFVIGIAAFLGCAACLMAARSRLPEMDGDHETASLASFLYIAPALLLAVAVAAGFEQSMLALFPVYSAHYGMDERTMAALLTVMIAGNIALQVPLGLLAEHYRPRIVMIVCAVLSVVGVALLPLLVGTATIWPMLFILGAVSYGIYTMAIIELGNRFTGAALIAGNAAFALMWGIGGIAAPPATGAMMQIIGAHGLPIAMGAICAVLILFAVYRQIRRGEAA